MNKDLPKIKLPKLPRDLSRREVLSLIGVVVVLLAIPLTVILFRRYQETRIKAYENAQIVDGTVKVTNIHAHGFTVSWATRGTSTGIVQWGPTGQPLVQTAYDDRAEDNLSFSSSTHHVTLPYPPGSDETNELFNTPEQTFDLKILSGDNKLYGGTFDNVFDVVDVSSTAAPIRVTTGPELSTGLPDGSLSSVVLTSDQNIVAINNTNRTGEPAETFTYTSAKNTGKTVFLPLFAKNAATDPFKGFGSTLQVQNPGDQPANITLHFYTLDDGTEVGNPNDPSQKLTIPAHGFRQRWWKDDLPSLPDGFLGSVVVESDQNVTAMANTKGEGGNLETGGDRGFVSSEAAQSYYLPFFAKNYEGYNSNIIVQNTGNVQTFVTVQFYQASGEALGFIGDWIPPRSNLIIVASVLMPPDPIPDNFSGSVLIQSHRSTPYDGSADGENIVATVFNINADPYLSFAYNGFRPAVAGSDQFSPLFAKGSHDQVSTLYLHNISNTMTAPIIARFYDIEGVLRGTVRQTIPVKGLLEIDATDIAEIPIGFLGSVIIESDGGNFTAVTKTTRITNFETGGFETLSLGGDTGTTLYFPFYSNNFHNQISSIQVQNTADGDTANICFHAYDAEGREVYSECAAVAPFGFHQFYAPSLNQCHEPLPDIAPGCPDPVYGEVQKSSGVAAPGAIVYTTVRDSSGNLSAPLSTVTNNDGRYTIDLGNARTQDRSHYFSYDREAADGYWEDLAAQGGVDGAAELKNNPTNNDQPIPTLILNHPPVISPIEDHNATEGVAYSYQVVATDPDGDTLTYGLDNPPAGMTIDQNGLISWPNPTGGSDTTCGGQEWEGYCWYEGAEGQSCATVCATHGGNAGTCQENDNSSCDLCHLFHPDGGCLGVNETYDPIYFPYFNRCDYRASPTAGDCSTSNPGGRRFCACAASSSPGAFHISVWVNDGKSGGRVTEDYTLTVVKGADTTPPETEIVSGPAEGETVKTGSVTFTYTGTDNITAMEDLVYSYKLDDGNWSEWSSATTATVAVSADAHTFSVKAKDEVGLEDATPAQRSFNVVLFNRVEITPLSKTLEVGQAQNFTATTYDSNNNPITSGVTYVWNVEGTIGTVSPTDQQTTTFTATTIGDGQVKVTAAVSGDSLSAQAPVTVVATLNCEQSYITPGTFEIAPGGEQGLTTTAVGGSGSYTYAWQATGGSFVGGTTTRTVTWKAPADAQDGTTFTISVAITDNVTGTSCPAASTTATATIQTGQPSVGINPTSALLEIGDTESFTAQFYDADGNLVATGVTYVWTVTGNIGTVSPTNQRTTVFTAATVGTGTVHVTASLGADSPSTQAPVTVIAPLNCSESYITPASFWAAPSGTKILTAHAVGGSGSYGYSWTASGGSFAGATNSQTATWQAPAEASNGQTFTINVAITDNETGTSCPAAGITATATVYTTLSCSVSPEAFEIAPGGTKTLNLTINGGSNDKTVAWTKSGGDFVGATNGTSVEWKAPTGATNGQTFTITATVTDNVTTNICSDSATATVRVAAAPTLNISLLMQGRSSDSRGSSGTVDIFARRPGETAKLWEVDDQAVSAGGATGALTLQGLSVGTAYDFFLKGYIHLTVKKNLTLGSENSTNFGTILVGDLNSTRDNQVNSLDNDILLTGWQQTWNSPQICPNNYADCKLADFNLDSKVNSIDHDYIFSNWGKNGEQ